MGDEDDRGRCLRGEMEHEMANIRAINEDQDTYGDASSFVSGESTL